MFDRFKQKPKVQVVKPDVIPEHIMPNREHIISLGYSEAKQYFDGFLEGLTRTQLMDFQDSKQFDGTAVEEAAWECANDAEWKREYPMGKYEYEERIPDIVANSLPVRYTRKKDKNGRDIDLDLNELEKQVQGIQKKLDKVETLISTAEFKLCGKDALKL